MADPDRVADLLIRLRENGIHLTEMSVQKPTLDEVFLTITGHDAADQSDLAAPAGETQDALEGVPA